MNMKGNRSGLRVALLLITILVTGLFCPLLAWEAESLGENPILSLAEQGDANAQWMMGQTLLSASDLLEDATRAAWWLRRAADQGHGLAQRDLGMLHELGRGVEQSVEEAFFWYSLASVQESGRAKLHRDAMKPQLTPAQQYAVSARLRDWRPRR